jgi:nucleoside-diphosphate-sugar epimerase
MDLKRVLITGKNSYVGTNVEKWLMREPDKYYVEFISVRDDSWKDFDFSKFDVVFHVAGIAHVSTKKSMKDLYFKVNRDLAVETARLSKDSGIKQFIFMSSMIVYNSMETIISANTKPNPDNFYGLSKLEAEEQILKLQDDSFKIVILRPPMIYGPNSKGNFLKLKILASKTLIFPDIKNKRSTLYIDNLCRVIKEIIKLNNNGIYFPQNKEYSSTSSIVREFGNILNKKIYFVKVFNPLIKVFRRRISLFNKLFGDYYYDYNLSLNIIDHSTISLKESILNIINHE